MQGWGVPMALWDLLAAVLGVQGAEFARKIGPNARRSRSSRPCALERSGGKEALGALTFECGGCALRAVRDASADPAGRDLICRN